MADSPRYGAASGEGAARSDDHHRNWMICPATFRLDVRVSSALAAGPRDPVEEAGDDAEDEDLDEDDLDEDGEAEDGLEDGFEDGGLGDEDGAADGVVRPDGGPRGYD